MTRCPRAAHMAFVAAALSVYAFGQSGPQPPCGLEVFPPYPVLDSPPAVKVWQRAGWTPPACTGWAPSPSSTLVAASARFRYSSGPEGLLRRIGAVSQLKGLLYWSATAGRWQPLILDAYAVSGPAGDHRRNDFSPAELVPGRALYVRQQDNVYGKAVYRMAILAVSPSRVAFATGNADAMGYLGLPLFPPGEFQTVCFLDRESSDVWRYYAIARTGKQASALLAGHEASLINRAVASFRHLAGMPADAEPPAAR
jgi:hypothetical protein